MSLTNDPELDELYDFALRAVAAEKKDKERLHYISYASETGYVGGMMVMARGYLHALFSAGKHGAPQGCNVMVIPAPPETMVKPEYMNRLLDSEELEVAMGELETIIC